MSGEYPFSDWSIPRKIRALNLMDEYIRTHAKRSIYETEWTKYGAHPFQLDLLREIANDESKFIKALFCFYICWTTDLSWLKL